MRIFASLLWLLPFSCFCAGYFMARVLLSKRHVIIPSLIGKTADTALIALSEKNLNPRVIGTVEDPDQEPGTVLSQIPRAGSRARPYQAVFILITARPLQHKAHDWVGKTENIVRGMHATSQIQAVYKQLAHTLPAGTCFGQFPSPGQLIADKPLVYISSGTNQLYIWPSCIGAPALPVFDALKKQGIEVTIIGEYAQADPTLYARLRIIDQRPLPGAFMVCEGMHKPSFHVRLGI